MIPPPVPWERVRALFVAPHFDDVALSCGGSVMAHAAAADHPAVVTVATAGPGSNGVPSTPALRTFEAASGYPDQGDRLIEQRRIEDINAMAVLGAHSTWLGLPDALYRGLSQLLASPFDHDLCSCIGDRLLELWKATDRALVYLPLGIGNHVDHQICAMTHAKLRSAGAEVWHYEDIPYALWFHTGEVKLRRLRVAPSRFEVRPFLQQWLESMGMEARLVNVTAYLQGRLAAIGCYESQVPMLFTDGDYRGPIVRYVQSISGDRPDGSVERFWRLCS